MKERQNELINIVNELIDIANELISLGQFAKLRRIPKDLKRLEDEEEVFLSEEKEKEYLQKAVELPLTKEARIVQRQREGKKVWCVESEKTGRSFGCYPTRKQAEERLKQVEMFKHMKKKK
jgi:hypothetical protein